MEKVGNSINSTDTNILHIVCSSTLIKSHPCYICSVSCIIHFYLRRHKPISLVELKIGDCLLIYSYQCSSPHSPATSLFSLSHWRPPLYSHWVTDGHLSILTESLSATSLFPLSHGQPPLYSHWVTDGHLSILTESLTATSLFSLSHGQPPLYSHWVTDGHLSILTESLTACHLDIQSRIFWVA